MQFFWNVGSLANRQRRTPCLLSGHMVVFYSILLRFVIYLQITYYELPLTEFYKSKFYVQQICSIDAKRTTAKILLPTSSLSMKNG
jgi:hypothetical protein